MRSSTFSVLLLAVACGGRAIDIEPGAGNSAGGARASAGSPNEQAGGTVRGQSGNFSVGGSISGQAGTTGSGGSSAHGGAGAAGLAGSASGGSSNLGGNGALGGSGAVAGNGPIGSSGAGGTWGSSDAGLVDILPQFFRTTACDACMRMQCPEALICSRDSVCLGEMDCAVSSCWQSGTSTDAANCMQKTATCRAHPTESYCNVDLSCGDANPAAMQGGLEAVDCLYTLCQETCRQ